jgi:putative oxidoreductase
MEMFNKRLASWEPVARSIFRIVTALLMFQFGVAKLLKFPVVPQFEKVEPLSLFGVAGMFELIVGAFLLVGLFSRLAAFILCGEMAFAYFIAHFPRGFIPLLNGGNLAIMMCFSCLYLACAGGGPLSLDAVLRKKKD